MKDIHYCSKDDAKYPDALKNIKNAPATIYYKGNIEIVTKYKNIAVIGSRECSTYGIHLAYETAKYLSNRQINIVNGLALGCDTAALRQYKRLACYHYKLLEYSTDNKYLEEIKETKVLKQLSNLEEFVNGILDEEKYEQMTLHF